MDLNLLRTLDAVLSERSVARAARRLNVTPSAVSNALARLRREFDDPLVVRDGRGVVPTPRTIALAPALTDALQSLERAISNESFDPATTTRRFTLALADAGQSSQLPKLGRLMAGDMPCASLRVVGIDTLLSCGAWRAPRSTPRSQGSTRRRRGCTHSPFTRSGASWWLDVLIPPLVNI